MHTPRHRKTSRPHAHRGWQALVALTLGLVAAWLVAARPAASRGAVPAAGAPAAGAPAPGAGAAASPSAAEILRRTAEVYSALTSYRFEGSLEGEVVMGDQSRPSSSSVELAYVGPSRLRVRMNAPGTGYLLVIAGDSTLVYLPPYQQAQVLSTDQARATMGTAPVAGLPDVFRNPLGYYQILPGHTLESRIVGDDTLAVDGAPVDCFVLEAAYDSVLAPGDSTARTSPHRLWIDKQRFLVLRDHYEVSRRNPAGGEPMLFRQTTTYRVARSNEALPDSLFAIALPAGARRVERFEAPQPPQAPDPTGRIAAEFALSDLSGRKHTLSALRGKVVLLDFWATWCGPCRLELPRIQKLHRELSAKGLVVLAINCGESADVAGAFTKKYAYTFPVLLDRTQKVQGQYGVDAIPAVFVLDRKGRISGHLVGVREESDLRAALTRAGLR